MIAANQLVERHKQLNMWFNFEPILALYVYIAQYTLKEDMCLEIFLLVNKSIPSSFQR